MRQGEAPGLHQPPPHARPHAQGAKAAPQWYSMDAVTNNSTHQLDTQIQDSPAKDGAVAAHQKLGKAAQRERERDGTGQRYEEIERGQRAQGGACAHPPAYDRPHSCTERSRRNERPLWVEGRGGGACTHSLPAYRRGIPGCNFQIIVDWGGPRAVDLDLVHQQAWAEAAG